MTPELALVDRGAAREARASLPIPDDTLERILRERENGEDAEAALALRRILELSVLEPSGPQPRFRLAKLVGALATWSIVVTLSQVYATLS
jgi:hypothetical protein